MNYQTDFEGFIRADGCLLFTIFRWCEIIAMKPLKARHILNIIDTLHYYRKASYDTTLTTPVLSDEKDKTKEGVFVWDHEGAFNETLKFLGSDRRVRYTGRIYMPWEEKRGRASFGEHGGEILILQVLTVNGNGHFQSVDYNPWQPAPSVADIKSLRFYKVIG